VDISIANPVDNGEPYGMYKLQLTRRLTPTELGESWHTGISVHLIGGAYDPVVYDSSDYVADNTRGAVQAAIDAWEGDVANHGSGGIVLIRPAPVDTSNPEGAHLENLIMSRPVKLQGFGPGHDNLVATDTQGTHLSGAAFGAGILCNPFQVPDLFCDTLARDAWLARVESAAAALGDIANNNLVQGSVLYVLGGTAQVIDTNNEALTGGIDGCRISGGFQENAVQQPAPGAGLPEVSAVQGGGITLHSYTNYFRITNNNIVGNSGSYAGGIRVGTPFLNQADGSGSSFNKYLTIAGNQIKYNGGFNLAGGKVAVTATYCPTDVCVHLFHS